LPQLQAFAREFMEKEGLAKPEPMPSPSGDARRQTFSKDFFEAQMEVVIEERVPVYAAGLGDPGPWIPRLRKNGSVVMAVVGAVRHARRVAESGVDIIVAQGHDAGGHNSPIGTMALVPQVVDAVAPIPVLGAGGISDGRGLAAVMMLGAAGAWIGSAFLATIEAGITDFQKQASSTATRRTRSSRAASRESRRLIRSKWTGLGGERPRGPAHALPAWFRGPCLPGWPPVAPTSCPARGAGHRHGPGRPAAEVLREIVAGAQRALEHASGRL
jgi:hypothetical protein